MRRCSSLGSARRPGSDRLLSPVWRQPSGTMEGVIFRPATGTSSHFIGYRAGTPIVWRCEGKMTSKNNPTNCSVLSRDERSDENLIKAIVAGNQAALRTLYERHHVRLYHFIVRLGCDTDCAEDVVSEVFLTVWRQAGTFESRSQVSTWIMSIVRFKALTALSKRREPHLNEEAMEMVADDADTPEQTVLHTDRRARLRRSCRRTLRLSSSRQPNKGRLARLRLRTPTPNTSPDHQGPEWSRLILICRCKRAKNPSRRGPDDRGVAI
jgi:RNA polymerase sigma factor (sigma-70 family)